MFNNTFNHNLTRKYTSAFGTLFNDLYVNRSDASGNVIQTMKVPLTYGPKDKILSRVGLDPNLDVNVAMTLPRISFKMVNFQYSPERKLNSVERIHSPDPANPDREIYQYVPVPYDFLYTVSIIAKSTSDLFFISEQILPYFTPEFTLGVELIPEMGVTRDVQIALTSTLFQEEYEGNFEERRYVSMDLDFTLYGFFFGPVRTGKIIKQVEINYFESLTANTASISTSTRPGLTANGTATSNSSLTIDKSLISSDDDYGIIKTFTEDQ